LQIKLPHKLISSLEKIKGFDKEAFEKVHESGEQVTSVRINPEKISSMVSGQSSMESQISNSPFTIHYSPIPWSSHGYYLDKRPSFTLDPLFHAGTYYVQEASSMFLEEALKQTVDLTKPLRVLDLCAAPGGKSTLIQSLISEKSLLVSNEVIKSRVNILTENIIKWGSDNVIVTNNDPKDFSRVENYFDVVVIDAPCSGSGLFRKEPDAINEWSEENVNLCNYRQQRIIADAMPSLKLNGILIYSTCSYSKQEDEDILDWMTERFEVKSLRLKVEENWNIVETISSKTKGYGYRFYPDKLKGEGFFIAAVQKIEGNDFHFPKTKKNNSEKLTKYEELIVRKWISDNTGLTFLKNNEFVYAIPSNLLGDFSFLQSSLYIKKAGVLLGKIAHGELIPEQQLALSNIINDDIQSINFTKDQARNYLRKEEIKIETNLKGWCIVKYEDQNLGWIKILQNRINNYYPSEWRVRKSDVKGQQLDGGASDF
jgi:16S rRNA C967 or C1407 C5-methylase (RsmB/RsmF family)/NOL1/NOP2/fmu family ribosome biogenesis protein